MKQHKWAKEIKAWADGAEIEKTWTGFQSWTTTEFPEWQDSTLTFRIKPQDICKCQKQTCSALKEPQYLYVAKSLDGYTSCSLDPTINTGWNYIGKIKLEVDDD